MGVVSYREGNGSRGSGGDSGRGAALFDIAIRAYKPGAEEEGNGKLDGTWREAGVSPRPPSKGRGSSAAVGPLLPPAGGQSPGRVPVLEGGLRSLNTFGEHQVSSGAQCFKTRALSYL